MLRGGLVPRVAEERQTLPYAGIDLTLGMAAVLFLRVPVLKPEQ